MRLAPLLLAAVACARREEGVEAVSGELTWTLDFDGADVEGCSYTRAYDGLTDLSAPWLCPDCLSTWRAEVDVDRDGKDCYERLFGRTPDAVEWLGWDGGEARRGPRNYRLGSLGAADWDGDDRLAVSFEETYTGAELLVLGVPPEATVRMSVEGELTRRPGEGDPMHGFEPPDEYACGWPQSDAPPYEGDSVLVGGGVVPDGFFLDGCGEPVRLHHLSGRYLVIDVSAVDCPPCQIMAEEAPAFREEMETAGLDVMTVTLLAPSLGAVLEPTPRRTLNDWSDTFGLHDPVLSDRGWGLWVAGSYVGESFGYPTWIVVAPDLTVIGVGNGYAGWGPIADVVRDHAGG